MQKPNLKWSFEQEKACLKIQDVVELKKYLNKCEAK